MRIILILWSLSLVCQICSDPGGQKKKGAWGWFKNTSLGQKLTSGGRDAHQKIIHQARNGKGVIQERAVQAGQAVVNHRYVQQAKNGRDLIQDKVGQAGQAVANHRYVQQAKNGKDLIQGKMGEAYAKVRPKKSGAVNGGAEQEYNIGEMYGDGLLNGEARRQHTTAAENRPAAEYHGPCVQYCANIFGFVFKSTSVDGNLRFSDGIVFPMVRGRVNPLSRWKSIKEWKKTGEYNHIPYQCLCETTPEFKQLMEDYDLGLKQFENLKKAEVKEAHEFSLGALKRLNDKVGGSPLYAYVDHRGLIALILAEMNSHTEDPVRKQAEDALRRSKSVRSREVYLQGADDA